MLYAEFERFAARRPGVGAGVRTKWLTAVSAVAICASAAAQSPAPSELRQRLDARQLELRSAQDTMKAAESQRRAMEAELELLRNDRARLTGALIDTTARAQAAEARIAATERRLEASLSSEQAIQRSLEARREVVGEVLAALQRMGRKPLPAVLVTPQDMLRAIRTSMLLGAVLPELRAETRALAADLVDLGAVRKSVAAEREQLSGDLAGLAGERTQLAGLVEARQKTLAETEQALQAERSRAQALARQATDLRDLVQRLETDVSSADRTAEAARRAEEAQDWAAQEKLAREKLAREKLAREKLTRDTAAQEKPVQEKPLEPPRTRLALGPFRDSARLSPALPFNEARGLLPLPAAGSIAKPFGSPDGFGGVERGVSLNVRAGAAVASPTDGWVLFSGPYRSYGQLLIINAGNGYLVVLAGMEKINVEVRQFVLTGEPIGVMGEDGAKTAVALALGATQPILYVEFRKDGTSIDPGPWWAKPEQEKVRG